ncbi:hypothetical protein LguiA_006953 [Lonicera macranthoides]
MADTVVSFLLKNVAQMLNQEANLLLGVGDQVRSLHRELTEIHRFLQNSKEKRERVKDLVSQIWIVAHKAEDVIDTFVVNMAKHKRRNPFEKFVHGSKHAKMLRSVAADIRSINKEIMRIYNSQDMYQIENKEATEDSVKRRALHERRGKVEENEVVSYVKNAKTVMKQLCKGTTKRNVVSIVGMGGLGKTTLAKKIYNDNYVKKLFDCRAWVYVSQEFRTRELLLHILQLVVPSTKKVEEMGDKKLVEELKRCLDRKRYLIVLDDVWDNNVWDEIKGAFPDNMTGSRILITTRDKKVAKYASPSTEPYLLPLLTEEASWELFSRKAFRREACPPQLVASAKQIAEKCNGLPLAIVVAAGILAKEHKSIENWSQMALSVSSALNKEQEELSDILALSYEDLPPHLKPCFLYFGVFPEDFEVPARQLIRLWIAEGFMGLDKSKSIEAIAENYLEELIDRSLIMVAKRSSCGGIKSCCIHDVLRKLCISESIRENFSAIHKDHVISSRSITTKPRILSIDCSSSRSISSVPCYSSRVRSVLCFSDLGDLRHFHSILYEGFPLIRVLDLGSTVVKGDGINVENLILLKYLRMNAPDLGHIPSSISSLPNLQTLDLRGSKIVYLTENFWKMEQLRHLLLSGDCDLPYNRRKEVKTMLNLQTLSTLSPRILSLLDFNTVFPNVTKVGFRRSDTNRIWCTLPNFKCIRTLKIINSRFDPIHHPAALLSLTKITLLDTMIYLETFETLAKVPNLQVLKLLKNSVDETTIEFKQGWFPKLEVLHMVELRVVKWMMERGALQGLSYLFISKCPGLTTIPEQLKHVSSLSHVKAEWCSSRLEKSILTLGETVQYEFRGYRPGGWANLTN